MPTPGHLVRINDTDWDEFGELADAAGRDRSAIIRQLVLWWMRTPGVTLPKRPDRVSS